MDPVSAATVLTSLIPTGSYVVKRLIDYWTGGAAPVNSEEASRAREADANVLHAISALEGQQETYKWVAAVRQLQRPIVAFMVLLNWTILTIAGSFGADINLQIYVIVANLASAVFFYLFGDRSLMYSLERLNKKLLVNTNERK